VRGRVAGIYVGMSPGAPMRRVSFVEAVAGAGLRGDRYFAEDDDHDPPEEITIFSREDVEAAAAESGIDITPGDLRRNIMTAGVDLQGAIGGRLRIGDVVVDSLEANPPCAHLQRLARKALLEPLVDRGGLRGRLVVSGPIEEGDPVEILSD
jgi:MOSC domain-containing protein YiiM